MHQVFGVWRNNQPFDEAKSLGPSAAQKAAARNQETSPIQTAVTAANENLSSTAPAIEQDTLSQPTADKPAQQEGPMDSPQDPPRESSRHDSAIPRRVARQQSSTPIHRATEILTHDIREHQGKSFCHAIPPKTHHTNATTLNRPNRTRTKTSENRNLIETENQSKKNGVITPDAH